MTFQFLLWLLGKRINWLAENDAEFKKAIKGRVCVMQFRTADNRARQYYKFAAGKTDTATGLHSKPSITFSFKSTGTAMGLILKMAKDPSDKGVFMEAIRQGKLRISGDMSLLAWFMTVSDHFAPV